MRIFKIRRAPTVTIPQAPVRPVPVRTQRRVLPRDPAVIAVVKSDLEFALHREGDVLLRRAYLEEMVREALARAVNYGTDMAALRAELEQ